MKENNNHEQPGDIGHYNNKCFVNSETIYNVRGNQYGVLFGRFNAKCMQNALTNNNIRNGQ